MTSTCESNIYPTDIVFSTMSVADKSTDTLAYKSDAIERLLIEKNEVKRKYQCELMIANLEEDLKQLNDDMDSNISKNNDFKKSKHCRKMKRRKTTMLKELSALEMFNEQLQSEGRRGVSDAHLAQTVGDHSQTSPTTQAHTNLSAALMATWVSIFPIINVVPFIISWRFFY